MIKRISFFIAIVIASFAQAQMPGSGNAFNFSSNDITVPNTMSLNPTFISIEAWIKADSWGFNSWENVIVSKDGWASGDQGYTLRAGANGTLSFNISSSGSWVETTSAPTMQLNTWYHVAGTYDGTTLRVYINGEEVGSTAHTGSIQNGSYDVTIGRISYTAGGGRYFDGMIDEVRIWNSAIPQSSIQSYMCQKVTSMHPEYANLSAYWNFDDAGTVIDQSVNGNSGTVNGATQQLSGAPIGDESIFSYGGPVDLVLPWAGTDSLEVSTATIMEFVHVYRIDDTPQNPVTASGITLDPTHYYGIFAGNSQAYSLNTTYHYGTNALAAGNEAYTILTGHLDGSVPFWSNENSSQDQTLNTLSKNYTTRREVALSIYCPSAGFSPSGVQSICAGDSINLNNNSSATIYQWYDANGPITGETSSSLTVNSTGDFYLIANDGECSDTSNTLMLSVNPIPTVSFGDLPTSICEGEADTAILNGSPSGGVYAGMGIVNSSFSPSTAGTGTYWIYYNYTDPNTTCSNIDSSQIVVNAQPNVPIITTNGDEMCISSTPGATYQWYLDGMMMNGETDTCVTAIVNGDYSVTTTTSDNCSESSTETTISIIGLDENSAFNGIVLSPNPTIGTITIQLNSSSDLTTKAIISDLSGRVFHEGVQTGSNLIYNLEQYPSGTYLLQLTQNGESTLIKVVRK